MYEVELKVRGDHAPVRERLDALGAEPFGAVEQADTYYDHPGREFAETDEALRVRRERRVPREDRGGPDVTAGTAVSDTDPDTGDRRELDVTLTYKGPLVEAESKTREEIETGVKDGEAMREVLRKVGFEPVQTVEKRRERFRVDGYTVALDTVEGLGEFVEVEVEVEVEGGGDVEVDGDGEVQDAGGGGDTADGDGDGSVETDAPVVVAAREDAAAILEALDLDPDEQIRTSYLGLLLAEES